MAENKTQGTEVPFSLFVIGVVIAVILIVAITFNNVG